MECALLLACALPAARSGPPWGPAGRGRVAKALQLCCLCCASVAAALASDSRGGGGNGLNHDYVFVTPVEVDSGGSYVSHDVLHNGRKKRSAQSASSSLHYRFSAFGQELHLELKPSAILSSHFIVQVLGKGGASETREPVVPRCFYQGFIRNDSSSSVAVSTCAGLSGLIRTRKNEFLISPLPQLLAQEHNYTSPAGHHPHVLYKRTAEEKVQRCHGYLSSSGNSAGHSPSRTPHTSWSPERKHHHGRLQRQHFCGRRKKCMFSQVPLGVLTLQVKIGLRYAPTDINLGDEPEIIPVRQKLGFAPISGMCSKYRSCTINEDTGLGLAFTIAHESGHNFGMVHDGEGNPCRKAEGNIMSPTLTGNNGVFSWSSCSRQYLKKFLSTPQAGCLVDEPKQTGQYKYPDQLPGQIYDADTQCKWQFGAKAKLCSLGFVKDICKSLWCHRVGHRCETKFMPAAEGTVCGLSMWCRQGQCVKFGEHGPRPIHGQWSAWSKWSECSRTCGGGVKYQERHCNNPKPQYGGKFCPGSSRVYQLCNINPCNENSLDFRAQQCAEYNSKPFRGWFYQWKPYTKVEEEDRCKLYCKAENFEFFFAMSSKVKDGTPCSPHRNDVCIDGTCEPVGCDHELGSKAVSDACGVCKGDNSTCKFYKGLYLNQHKANEYYPVVTIPPGARSIEVQELQISSSYLAVRGLSHKYYLTGGWSIDWPGEFAFAGTVFEYQRTFNHPERLSALGPTNETLVFEILMQGPNPGISWKYALPQVVNGTQPASERHSHTWSTVQSPCSFSCGGGYISVKAICLRDQNTPVNSSFCNARAKPATEPKMCNAFSCPAYWKPGEWSVCSRSCAGGQQRRKVQCVQKQPFQKEEAVPHSLCPVSTPTQLQVCNSHACPPEWSPGPWSQCSKTCGRGMRKREVLCKSSATVEDVPESLCASSPRPESQEGCVLGRCPKNSRLQWVVSSWSECSASCGLGVRKREMKCGEKAFQGKLITLPERRCRNIKKPNLDLEETCNRGVCPARPVYSMAAGWYSSPWQQCTVTCGGGVQTRSVHCVQQGRPSSSCLLRQKPPVLRACNTNFCPAPEKREDPSCVDFFGWCHLVPQHGVCNHKFYGKQCCKSCTRKS
ncbi:A disintegrin and metalloproteinase with thrombospondin motifs 18 [Physeter macrocephalus]|uniref:A disintegrin and metalloproteinase with thrombospondin motifs 18 n=1 Tax=Physeter macrocephalus TaxID=9755 RepID=A0A2Y9SU07_PHYMC|nr:A disintegrin and metalloproteinase with thrombospondin motifs 18 [Physeter catodon]|eukprot:XP_023980917.1 A disintegrin and metalloproteinase with thrombospondin motifs 18 [Physeter catodon]